MKIKVNENSSSLTITDLDDFKDHFPDIDITPPTEESYSFDGS